MTNNDSLNALLNAYAGTWGPIDNDERTATFQRVLHEDFVYSDPNIETVGYDDLAAYMNGFQIQVPGGGFTNRHIAKHHDVLLLQWDMTGPDGSVVSPGASFGRIHPDGRLASMTGFYEQ